MLHWMKKRWAWQGASRPSTFQSTVGLLNMQADSLWQTASAGLSAQQAIEQFDSWVYAAAMLNAQAFAAVPLRMYVRKRLGRKLYATAPVSFKRKCYLTGDRSDNLRPSATVYRKAADWRSDFEEVTEAHPALNLLAGANPHHNGLELATLRLLYLQMTGNAYIHPIIDSSSQLPSGLVILPSQWVQVMHDAHHTIQAYRYGQLANTRTFAPQEVIHWKLPNLANPACGRGCVEALWGALGLHQSKRQMDLARFANHARPDFLLIVKQGATPEALDRFEKQIDAKLRGVRQSGKFITITGDVQATPLSFPNQTLGDNDRVLEEIAACFGVPISKLLANDPNRASAQTADSAWMRDTILPYCRLDEEKLNEALLPLFDIQDDAFFAYDNPVPEDRQLAMQRRVAYIKAGIMTRDEARSEEGLPPWPHDEPSEAQTSSTATPTSTLTR